MDSVNFDVTNVTVRPAISPAAARIASTTGTAVDTALGGGRYAKSVHFIFLTGVLTDGTYTLSVEECDTSAGTYTAVPAGRSFNTVGTIAATADDTAFQLSAKIDKRFCRLVVTAAGTTAGGIYSAVAVMKEV